MKKLLYKELRLALHPASIAFIFLSAMLLIPNYPYYVAFFYTCLGIFFTCLTGRENHDILYTAMLPVKKRNVITARIWFAIILQVIQVITAIPFMLIRRSMPVPPNQVGMEANLVMLGVAFVLMGLFNLVFFGIYCKTPKKVGRAFVSASAVMFIAMLAAEVLAHFPYISTVLDSFDAAFLPQRAAVFIIGLVIYVLLNTAVICSGRKSFEKYDID